MTWLLDWLISWLIDWFVGRLIVWLIDWLIDLSNDWLSSWSDWLDDCVEYAPVSNNMVISGDLPLQNYSVETWLWKLNVIIDYMQYITASMHWGFKPKPEVDTLPLNGYMAVNGLIGFNIWFFKICSASPQIKKKNHTSSDRFIIFHI